MVGSILSYFGLGAVSHSLPEEKQTVRALPGNWYTSQDMYQLERRAIFTRRWLLITHTSRLTKPSNHLRYIIANHDVAISKDEQGDIRACRSHSSGLIPVHTRVDRNGFIWINMDRNKEPEVSWESQFDHVDEQTRFDQFDFDDYEFDHTWSLDGPFNWKILADNFNECYHCKSTHPDLTTGLIDLESYDVFCDPKGDHIQHAPNTPEDRKALGQEICSTYCFPNVSFTVTKHFLFMQKFMPKSPTESIMYYEVWKNKKSSMDDFLLISDTYKRVMGEDKVLCERAQKNIDTGVFVNGELHPHMEKGPIFFQKRCREIVLAHHAREKREGRLI